PGARIARQTGGAPYRHEAAEADETHFLARFQGAGHRGDERLQGVLRLGLVEPCLIGDRANQLSLRHWCLPAQERRRSILMAPLGPGGLCPSLTSRQTKAARGNPAPPELSTVTRAGARSVRDDEVAFDLLGRRRNVGRLVLLVPLDRRQRLRERLRQGLVHRRHG